MTAYVILDVEVTDPTRYAEYRDLATPTVVKYGGKYIARGGKVENLEGDWSPSRVVIIQFESIEQARNWMNSPEYSPAKEIRHQASSTRSIVVEGL